MKVQLLKNAFKPDGARTPAILVRGSIVDLPEVEAEVLIEKGLAAEIKAKVEKKAEPKAKKEDVPPAK